MTKMTYENAVRNADHLKVIGWKEVYLYNGDSYPWEFANSVEAGGSYRLSGPAGARVTAEHPCGLTFSWNVDFESRDANGRGVHLFDRDRLREVMRHLPIKARADLRNLLNDQVLPGIAKLAAEIRESLNQQEDSLDLVRGLIAFADESSNA